MQIGVRAPVCFTHYTTPLPGAFFLPCLLMTRLKAGKRPKFGAEGAPRRLRAEKGIFSCAEWVTNCLLSRKTPQILRRRCSEAVSGRKTPPILRRRYLGVVSGRKRHHFLREMGYQLPAEQKNAPNPARKVPRSGFGQENAPNPARKVLRRHLGQKNTPNPAQKVLRGGSGQKKVSFPARKRIPTACRAGK